MCRADPPIHPIVGGDPTHFDVGQAERGLVRTEDIVLRQHHEFEIFTLIFAIESQRLFHLADDFFYFLPLEKTKDGTTCYFWLRAPSD